MCLVNWQAIEMGHTNKQITQYLGEPHLKSSTAGKQIWAYELMLGQAATITMVSNRVVAVSKPEISQLLFTAPYDRGSAAK
jgi:hypothetical protein